MEMTDTIRRELFALRDQKYGEFQRRLLPNLDPESILGVRTPALRDLAKRLAKEEGIGDFLAELPHRYFEENQLHAFLLSLEKDFSRCAAGVESFLPYVDNWATCDQMSPKVFRREAERLLPYIDRWLSSDHPYAVRFGVGMLMAHFLDGRFALSYPERVASVRSGEYYVNMMVAWYFATALAKQYESILPFLWQHRLDPWTHNKAIQKAVESARITPEQKAYLRTIRV